MIIVFGSVNIDLVVQVERLPREGETVLGSSYHAIAGGKGANQALAARRAGAEVVLAGAVGRDGFSGPALEHLEADGVDLSRMARADAPTGAAFIAVDKAGRNQIFVASGANAFADARSLDGLALGSGDILLLQNELAAAPTLAAARFARARGAAVILNQAPAAPLDPELASLIDVLIVNEHEAEALVATRGASAVLPEALAETLHRLTGLTVVVTLGAAGAIACKGGVVHAVQAAKVHVVDTTAAGDAFVGAFAAALQRGVHFSRALAEGCAAGSLACLIPGAQPSLPTRAAIEATADGLIPS